MDNKRIQMTIPGFTADVSLLHRRIRGYVCVASAPSSTGDGVVPQQQMRCSCFYSHSQGWICCCCTPHQGCDCRPAGQTMF
jgi:hypothetical protein